MRWNEQEGPFWELWCRPCCWLGFRKRDWRNGACRRQPEPPTKDVFKADPRLTLKQQHEETQRDAQRLFELAEELKKEVEKTDAAEVLSVAIIRKAEEIEKLAKRIKNRARG